MLLPLFPLGIEYYFVREISIKSITMAAAMYSLSIGVSSVNIILFSFFFLVSIFFWVSFGYFLSQETDAIIEKQMIDQISNSSYLLIIIVFGIHTAERIIRHFRYHESFPPFLEKYIRNRGG